MTIFVTGASRGLGKAIATRLGAVGVKRADADLSRMHDVRRLAHDVAARHPDLDVLINNAGVSKFTRDVTPDGLETTFAVNYMAPFLLSNLLLPVLARNRGMVVNIGSEQHRWGPRHTVGRPAGRTALPAHRAVQPDQALPAAVHA